MQHQVNAVFGMAIIGTITTAIILITKIAPLIGAILTQWLPADLALAIGYFVIGFSQFLIALMLSGQVDLMLWKD